MWFLPTATAIHEQVQGILQLPTEVLRHIHKHVQLWLRSPDKKVDQIDFTHVGGRHELSWESIHAGVDIGTDKSPYDRS